ncbi:TetR/AcrR family transcriptional regulator C-terminal domain-containing protein [Micromonospora sp. WMMD1128]|uniref:TetR/AcrR family transcriptional regulator n=1 Tax=unclassified Micromonospora TaxID=2617518 RepID=UPI00248D0060|nr:MULTISPECIES: TetR/AcrR family transcriptional regulator C-terminal domain-containing protein [unclassified Micromonospora]WBB74163.1 TetR/AcrR family transcriptional regulator C-terminal domain-containing protein [Micromonospora sp. WMMD1128]WFE32452.1 TetR/AcrR family transcriptional regulator C-terminal domain-containing protein [Micromonospora sp. WMMD975]
MPRPRSLTPVQLADAALAVLDRDGLAGLTMRAVGAQLGTSTMGLYRYVADRDELEALVVERILDRVDMRPPVDVPWPDGIRDLVDRVRSAVGAHPAVVPLLPAHRHHSPGILRWGEAVLAVLTRAGLAGTRRVVAFRALLGYVIGAIQMEHLGALAGPATAVIAALPRDEFPLLAETARAAGAVGPDDEFGGGLDLLLDGIARHLDR